MAEHNLYRARSWLFQYDVAASAAEADELARTLRPVVATARLGAESREATQAILRSGLWGLVAEASGLPPSRRIHLFEDAEVLEAEGDVRRLSGLPPRGRSVLTALARRPLSKEALLAAVWGVPSYRPERHDSVVKTTISRLRAALGRGHMWIETVEGGYGLAEGISRALAWLRSRGRAGVAGGGRGAADRWRRQGRRCRGSASGALGAPGAGDRAVGRAIRRRAGDRGSRVAAHGEPRSVRDAPAGPGRSRRRRPRHAAIARSRRPATRHRAGRCHQGGRGAP